MCEVLKITRCHREPIGGEGNHMNGQEDLPPEYGMELFGGQWNLRIICVFYKDEGVTPIVRCRKCDHKG